MPIPYQLPPEVPAFVQHENQIENHVRVQGGTNWDFSRTALTTPVVALKDPEQPKQVEASTNYAARGTNGGNTYVASVEFSRSSSSIPLNMQQLLKSLPKTPTYAVLGHIGTKDKGGVALSHKREAAVLALLRKNGNSVRDELAVSLDSHGEVPLKTMDQRVDVFVSY